MHSRLSLTTRRSEMLRSECFKGQRVVYRSGHIEAEEGVVTSMKDWYAFVRFGDDRDSRATRYDDLSTDQEGQDGSLHP